MKQKRIQNKQKRFYNIIKCISCEALNEPEAKKCHGCGSRFTRVSILRKP